MSDWKQMPQESGIYLIRNTVTKKVYVGSAICLRKRALEHRRLLRAGQHKNPILQASWSKHGEAAFTIEVLETCGSDDATLLVAEQKHLDALSKNFSLYNVCPIAGTRRGAKMPADAIERIAALKRGKKLPPRGPVTSEVREKIAAKLRGRKAPPEVIAKLSAVRKGKPKPSSFGERMSRIHAGRHISQEQREKISAKLKGRTVPPEVLAKRSATIAAKKALGWKRPPTNMTTRAKLSASLSGREMSDEARAKMSAARQGVSLSPGAKAKIAARMREIWKERRDGILPLPTKNR